MKREVSPPSSKADVPFNDFTFQSNIGKSISLPTGTSIVIEPGVLEFEDGKEVEGEVKLQYREVFDAVGSFLTGIPMAYDSAGEEHQLSTAGMFELKAFSDDKPLRIKEGKNIQINLANNEKGSEYNYYNFNKGSGNWDYLLTPEVKANTIKSEYAAKLAAFPPAPEKPKEFMNDVPVLDINSLKEKRTEMFTLSIKGVFSRSRTELQ